MATTTVQAPPAPPAPPQTHETDTGAAGHAPSDAESKAAAKVTRARGTTEARIAEKDAESARKAREAQSALDLRRQQIEVKLAEREAKAAATEAKRSGRSARRTARRQIRTARAVAAYTRIRDYIAGNAPAVYSAVIYAMALYVAVSGQLSMATDRGWHPLFGIGMAVFLEGLALSMALTAHQLRLRNERALIPTALTWIAAGFASGINYLAHRDDPILAVVLGASSLAAIIVWEVRSGAKHRAELRANGHLPEPPERFGWRRWLRYPRSTWRAWSLDVRDRVSDGAAALLARVETAVQDAAAAVSAEDAAAAQAAAVDAAEAAARESARARAAAAEAHRAARQAGPRRSLRDRLKRTAKETKATMAAPAPAPAPKPAPAPARRSAPDRPAPAAVDAPPVPRPAAPAPKAAEAPAVDFTVVEEAFVDLFVQHGRRPGSRLIERAVKGKPAAPRKTAIGDWLQRSGDRIDELTAQAEARLAVRATTEGPTA
jgi:hypothetical protein